MDYPMDLPSAHGRIDAYRSVLAEADGVLALTEPYVLAEEAAPIYAAVLGIRRMIQAELAVTNP